MNNLSVLYIFSMCTVYSVISCLRIASNLPYAERSEGGCPYQARKTGHEEVLRKRRLPPFSISEKRKGIYETTIYRKIELAVWNPNIKVSTEYLVSDGRNKYSAPFDLIRERVDIHLTLNTVEVFFHRNQVASRLRRGAAQQDPIIDENHMTPEHRKYLNYTRRFHSMGKICR